MFLFRKMSLGILTTTMNFNVPASRSSGDHCFISPLYCFYKKKNIKSQRFDLNNWQQWRCQMFLDAYSSKAHEILGKNPEVGEHVSAFS